MSQHERIEEGEVFDDWGHPPDRPICICEIPDYEGQPKVNGGRDEDCPVYGAEGR